MVKISGQRLKEVRLPVPTLDVQQKLVEDLDAARTSVEHLIAEQRAPEVSHLRDAILRKAFAGEL
jgi:type I restriction enzyme S subunit